VHDHPPLRAALDAHDRVVPVFVLDERLTDGGFPSANRAHFLLESLRELRLALQERGGTLMLRSGAPERELPRLAEETGASACYFASDVSPCATARDRRVEAALRDAGVAPRRTPGAFVADFGELERLATPWEMSGGRSARPVAVATTRRRSSITRSSAGAHWRPTPRRARKLPPIELFVQRDQPPGVPPLHLTGERTLPDVPEENYWFRRHLAVYEWIAARVHGRRVVDLACGEGYGCAVLARTAASVVGVDANPEAFAHARAKYTSATVGFERNMVELWRGDVDCAVFLQTIEHIPDPDGMLDHLRELVGPAGVAYVSTPNVLTLAPKGAERSGNPWHVREYRPEEYRALCARHFARVDLLGLFHARRLRAHEFAIEHLGWDRIHAGLRITKPFYDRFTPAISARDFALRRGDLTRALDLVAVLRPQGPGRV
jgi:2-polyprenyl-3-methyl-5-hydroxy-6-metoxy-1,4-benzoquinol methylase